MFTFDINEHEYKHIHFIGIGGISMSGLAEILLEEGYSISGSDVNSSHITDTLRKQGAKIYKTHDKNNISGADLVIYTDAISKDNEELLISIEENIPTIDRATFLGALMKNYKNSIAVSGTHGKTTTTGMITSILNKSTLNPTILLGGVLDEINGNVKIGSKDYLLTEACEYKGNILKYHPTMAIILNMEEDHLDYFENINHIVDTFAEYAQNIDDNGYLIINADDIHSEKVLNTTSCNTVTFGINSEADYRAENISYNKKGYSKFILNVKNQEKYPVSLNVMGIHNLYNALASIAAAHISNVPMEIILNALKDYKGTNRRLETKGSINGIKIMDDYAHHPTEIKATLKALKKAKANNIWCVFQPHTYTRTKLLFDSFSESFFDADKVIITDIYAAREQDTGIIHSINLVNSLKDNKVDTVYIDSFHKIETYLLENAQEGDIIVTMGAGNIHEVGENLLEAVKKEAM
ncbi:MAG TPA: UDP-N-acetylmuramate--L-alanine ligase [Tissierellales bacterium]|nr:UDP-N-acetylmuramate--L-alanine ligase [Tissierellales bacterium]